jgi:hypothetical protein
MTTVEADCRILAVVEADSQLAREILENDLGAVCASSAPRDIAAAIVAEASRAGSDAPGSIRTAGRRVYGQEAILLQWLELLANLERRAR